MKKNRTSYDTGLLAEMLAAWFMRLKGYRVVARRYKTPVGEIDMIVRRGRTLVFLEVKARGTLADALDSVHLHQRQRIIRAAQTYRPAAAFDTIRFDVIAIQLPLRIRHIEAAFNANGNWS